MNETSKAVVTVIGKDTVGILAKVSTACAKANANVIEVTQSVLENFFCMVMIIDITEATMQIDELQKSISEEVPAMQVHVMHENIFNSMHRI
ncbi:MAG: ACT domain-containing protein [Emergencia sp.]|nr:ACT domain-containing protein [Emergencia sp.]